MLTRELKLGTRRSLLAWAQSSWVATEIERLNPGVRVTLFGIDTRGDQIQHIPLQQVEGKDFFVAELDQALKSGIVDLSVHSMKDLSLDRPAEFIRAAIPKRENPRDVALFGPSILERLSSGKSVRIGTSSPRRLENIPHFLKSALPRLGLSLSLKRGEPKLELLEIRGNVNTRLSRVHEPEGSDRKLDAVILAMAGLIRLWADEKGRSELAKLLDGVRWMVLPLRPNPAAPAQGALAIECRADDLFVKDAISKLHHPETETHVSQERQLLADWGGGCHQRFGATSIDSEAGPLLFIRGKKSNGEHVEELRWNEPPSPSCLPSPQGEVRPWDGPAEREERVPVQVSPLTQAFDNESVFVAHSRAVSEASVTKLAQARVWTSGVPSWLRLASLGVWVEGCAEGLGYETLRTTLDEPVLQLRPEWTVLTHDAAQSGWQSEKVIATYTVPKASKLGFDPSIQSELAAATHIYWSSGSQFDELQGYCAKSAQHA